MNKCRSITSNVFRKGKRITSNQHAISLIKHVCRANRSAEDLLAMYRSIDRPNNEARECVLRFLLLRHRHLTDSLRVIEHLQQMDYKWLNAAMKMCINERQYSEALSMYQEYQTRMQCNDVSHIYAIQCCLNTNDFDKGRCIIRAALQCQQNQNESIELGNCLIHFYGYFGEIECALKVYKEMAVRDTVSVNSLMNAYLKNQMSEQALSVYMQAMPHSLINDRSHVLAIKACANLCDYARGLKLIQLGDLQHSHNRLVQNTLISFYGKCSDVPAAQSIFERMKQHKQLKVDTINAMMTLYCDNELYQDSADLFRLLESGTYDFKPSMVSYLVAIKACSHLGDISKAEELFDAIRHKSGESVNVMMQAYIENEQTHNALSLYHAYGSLHTEVSHLLALKACTQAGNKQKGRQIISIVDLKTCGLNLKHAIIDFYGSIGEIGNALTVFECIADAQKQTISFNAMMTAYLQNGRYIECVNLFTQLLHSNDGELTANVVSYVVMFKACTQGTLYHFGHDVHQQLVRTASDLLHHPSIAINLLYMYGKCGKMDVCEQILLQMHDKNVHEYQGNIDLWNAMIHSYGRNGQMKQAVNTLQRMKTETAMQADDKIYTTVITACNHCGEVDTALSLWQNEIRNHEKEEIKRNPYLMSTLIDCLSRSGYLREAYQFVLEFERESGAIIENPNHGAWMSLLSGCKKYGERSFGEQIYKEMQKRYGRDGRWKNHMASAAILLSSIGAFDE